MLPFIKKTERIIQFLLNNLGILVLVMVFIVVGITYAETFITWSTGEAPQAAPGEGNVELNLGGESGESSFLSLPIQTSAPDASSGYGRVYYREAAGGGESGGNDENTVLLIHSDSTNESTNFEDSSEGSYAPHTVTSIPWSGEYITHSDYVAQFGDTSIDFRDSYGYLEVATSEDFNFANANFTIDLWIYQTYINDGVIISKRNTGTGGGDNGWELYRNKANNLFYFSMEAGAVTYAGFRTANGISTTNDWMHVAIVRYGQEKNNMKFFVNGEEAEIIWYNGCDLEADEVVRNPTGPIIFGGYMYSGVAYNNRPYQGFMDEIRISKGIARTQDPNDYKYDGNNDGIFDGGVPPQSYGESLDTPAGLYFKDSSGVEHLITSTN